MVTTLGDKLRKNGKRPSCEPCRVRKQSCDHEQPCHRCQRHSRACFYAAAPMTKPKVPPGVNVNALPSPSSEGTPSSTSTFSVPAMPSSMIAAPPKPTSSKKVTKRISPLTLRSGGNLGYARIPSAWVQAGHTGKTAFSAILEEAEEVPNELWGDDLKDGKRPFWDDRGLEFCKEILAWMPRRDVVERVLRKWAEMAVLSDPILWRTIHENFWETYGAPLEDGSPRKIKQMADEIVQNTRVPMPCLPRTNREWLDAFLGRRTRWEIVGHIFVFLGESAISIPAYDSILVDLLPPECEGSKKNFACSMLECADACLLLADELDLEGNVFTASLRSRCVTLQSVVQGDTGIELFKRIGAMCNTMTGLGLHLNIKSLEPASALWLEYRAAVFNRAYCLDKSIASFTGRPPALSRRYVSTPMRLDLPDEVVWNESNHDILKSMVDANGWARAENPASLPASMHRAFVIMWYIRDEILEVSLGRNTEEDLPTRAAELRQKHRDAYDSIPEWVRREPTPEQFRENGVLGPTWAIYRIAVRNVMATNCLLIERITDVGRDEAWMLHTAKFILNNVLLLWNNRDHCVLFRDDIHWSLCSYGIPAASALALDLLRQTNSNAICSDRSEVIQQLSVFLVALDWVKPEDGNYTLCTKLGRMMKAILDRALSPPATVQSPSMPVFENLLEDMSGMDGFGTTDLGRFFDSYNEFDWSAGLQM